MAEAPVYILNGKKLNRNDFENWVLDSIFSELDKFLTADDRLLIAVSGGKDSTLLLDAVQKWTSLKNRSPPEALIIDEGICNYRNFTLDFLKEFCEQKKIKLHIVSFKEDTKFTLDEIIDKRNELNLEKTYGACTICGIFRRYLLNKTAKRLGATKLLTGHNLDDEVQTLLMNLFVGNIGQVSRKGELTGVLKSPHFVKRFKPLIWLPEKAITTYALLNYPMLPEGECPYLRESLRHNMRKLTNDLELQWPDFKLKIMKTYILKMLPHFGKVVKGKLIQCHICSEPSSQKICKVCELRKNLKL